MFCTKNVVCKGNFKHNESRENPDKEKHFTKGDF